MVIVMSALRTYFPRGNNMKQVLALLAVCFISSCTPSKAEDIQSANVSSVHSAYTNFSKYTDPGKYAYLYKNLPDSLSELCEIIKSQLIHPLDVDPYADVIPPNRYFEDFQYPTVKTMLAGLMKLDPSGLSRFRRPENRLVVSCRNHAILLASILKSRHIPVRVRYGFAAYLDPNKQAHISHVICEVWNIREKRWMLVDPDRKWVDFPRGEFELGGDVWLRYQKGEIKHPERYGLPNSWGSYNILDMMNHDFTSVLGQELLYWEKPPISLDTNIDISKMNKEQVEILNRISFLLKDPDQHMEELKNIYVKYTYLQYH